MRTPGRRLASVMERRGAGDEGSVYEEDGVHPGFEGAGVDGKIDMHGGDANPRFVVWDADADADDGGVGVTREFR